MTGAGATPPGGPRPPGGTPHIPKPPPVTEPTKTDDVKGPHKTATARKTQQPPEITPASQRLDTAQSQADQLEKNAKTKDDLARESAAPIFRPPRSIKI